VAVKRNLRVGFAFGPLGGLVLAALQIARAIADHKAKMGAFVPHSAMSGGTLIALAADEMVLSRYAVLGPVDPQLGKYPAASILRAIAKKPERIDDETLDPGRPGGHGDPSRAGGAGGAA
jgi:membrane-bound ClpP family serine protease